MPPLIFEGLHYQKRLKLLQLDETIASSLEKEFSVQFVSNSSAPDTVLCTPADTFLVTKIESSNSSLLMAGGSLELMPRIIHSIVRFHWEARRMNPRLNFSSSLPLYDKCMHARMGTAPDITQIRASTQASDAEIENGLRSSAVLSSNFGNHYYLKKSDFHECLDQVLMVISLQGWSSSAVPLQACVEEVAKYGIDIIIATHCLRHFALSVSQSGKVDLDIRHVARALTESLFATKMMYACSQDLIDDLSSSLPAAVKPSILWLDGLIRVSEDNGAITLA
eukprot:CAMPEP_0119260766 /NCGR_PEP_ID=MMETSP1329-20130426/1022_1 /TAXON_ID=114041 /ORGANISM="Genus nov. species nov., Strain RCC1024" /LENGTH=279 /DNA_ID=CAMNT_0007260209 /DNA_START=7 /DNA_END=846 /DNA_ORIENTATION=-